MPKYPGETGPLCAPAVFPSSRRAFVRLSCAMKRFALDKNRLLRYTVEYISAVTFVFEKKS